LGRTDSSDYRQNLNAVDRCLKMAKRTDQERRALRDAGYVYNQREQRWMSQDELQHWNMKQQRDTDMGKVVYVLSIIFVVVITAVTFMINM
jgi:hypothetical protein